MKLSKSKWSDKGKGTYLEDKDWNFDNKSRLLYSYFLNRFNTSFHRAAVGKKDIHGLELYCFVYNDVEALLANAEFHMHAELTLLSSKHTANINNLKDLYGF